MPIYEYHCEKCDKVLEINQKISDAPLTTCPSCADPGSLRKLISRSSFHLKGGGWYTTDYARPKAASEGAEASAKPKESSTESKSDAAPTCGQGACAACATDA